MLILSITAMTCFIWLMVKGIKGKVPTNLFLFVLFLHLLLYVLTFETSKLFVAGSLVFYYIGMKTNSKGLGIASLIGILSLTFLNLII